MNLGRFFISIILACASVGSNADSFKIKNCDADAAADIAEAYRFVSNNLDAIFDPMTFLTSSQRVEMKRKWDKLTANCIDDKQKCVQDPGLAGMTHGNRGNKINICYYNMVDAGNRLCSIVTTLVHEEGHANGIPRMKGHNQPDLNIHTNDLVYRMGYSAGAFCTTEASAGRFSDVILRGVTNLPLAASCSKNDQCNSGRCELGECVCRQDSDCANGQKCRKPLGGVNQCRP